MGNDKADKNVADKADHETITEEQKPLQSPKEIGGREGPDPIRYGDWENKGIASDF